ncbi:MAG: chromosomal replication initiator protein DnaA [Planctomycetaceae bacterium]|jgi:chromosomal replication initiator protein|nr:chromosomal replication initiator protein DnaA [Planctomycetaceae bacterium]
MKDIEPGFREALIGYLRKHHSEICRHWFDDIEPSQIKDGVLRLVVREPVQLRYLQRLGGTYFTEAAQNVTGRLLVVRFVSPEDEARFEAKGTLPAASDAESAERPAWLDEQMLLSPDYTFGSFIVGPGNRLAHAAAQAVVAKPARAYNPFFIHSGVGLGKTHLLHAMCDALLKAQPSLKLCYLSCSAFMDLFHEAVKAGRMTDFRNRFRTADVLVIDDIHFLSKHEQTQEEFFHTFNALYQLGKQIILSSDAAPSDIPDLEERLTSRFSAGMVARIERPCYETRVSILKTKAELHGMQIPDDVPAYIAAKVDTNIRELEGALTRVRGYAMAMGLPITLEVARQAIDGEGPSRSGNAPSLQAIIDSVTRYYDVKLTDLLSKRRHKSIAMPRQVCMYLARKHTRFSLEEIGGYFGGRDHTTVMHAVRTIEGKANADTKMQAELGSIEQDLLERSGR